MSFLGGSDCAAGANPLAQLSKRADFDTSLENSIRNSSAQIGGIPRQNGVHNDIMMNQQNLQMLNSFMDQGSSLDRADAFNFRPLAHEISQMGHYQQGRQQEQQQQHHQSQSLDHAMSGPSSWTVEFAKGNAQMGLPQQFTQGVSVEQNASNGIAHTLQRNHHVPMVTARMPAQLFQMGDPVQRWRLEQSGDQVNINTQNQSQEQNVHVDWENQFKELEQEVQNDIIVEDDFKSPLDVNSDIKNPFLGFNEKYHDDYHFEENNEFLHNPNAYQIGCKLMEGGAKLSEAALAFEAAVQEDPKHVDAWLKLGQVQIQNEKELHGITALENCLLLDNKNLTALMSLAISYVNEGYDNAAYKTFENWIETKYPDVVAKARLENPNDTSDDRYSLNKRITDLFLKAAQLSPSGVNVDADVQTGLGVLFYSMEEYDKTLDCFQAAIRCNPNDALSWNRLGASYANSNRSEQAIEAYSKALQLNPNFVRARYNLGVSFINMGMHKDAVEHLLTGLSMHEVEGPDGMMVSDTEQSSNLIETLKRAFLAMDRRELIDKVRPGMNIQQFRKEYNV